MLAACGNGTSNASGWKAGTYTASAKGINGDVTVEVVLSETKIESVKVVDHQETPGVSDGAIEKIPQAIVETQGLGVDIVSGASYTSNAIIEAVTLALKEAGADVDALKQIKQKATANEDIETSYDVVIIGGGGAGLTAAVTAAENGAKVVVLEKMSTVGGNTAISGGEMAAPGNWLQKKMELKTVPISCMKICLKVGIMKMTLALSG